MTTRELAHRTNSGLDVSLLWDPGENRVSVLVKDTRTGDVFEVEVGPGERALDVFNHPFAYQPVRIARLAAVA
jgi:hypothetical protein